MSDAQKDVADRQSDTEARLSLSLSFLSILLEKKRRGSYCQSDKALQSLINNSKNKRHKSCLPKHLCFPRKSKFIETKSSACSTVFFQTGILLRPKSTGVFHLSLFLSPDILSTQFFFHPFETLKTKVGERRQSSGGVRDRQGATLARISRDASQPTGGAAPSSAYTVIKLVYCLPSSSP